MAITSEDAYDCSISCNEAIWLLTFSLFYYVIISVCYVNKMWDFIELNEVSKFIRNIFSLTFTKLEASMGSAICQFVFWEFRKEHLSSTSLHIIRSGQLLLIDVKWEDREQMCLIKFKVS